MTTARDWYTDASDYKQLCLDARSQARGESAETFTHEMLLSANSLGLNAPLTYKQLCWLCRISDHVIPELRVPWR